MIKRKDKDIQSSSSVVDIIDVLELQAMVYKLTPVDYTVI